MRSLLLVETHVQDDGLSQEHTRPESLLESSGYLVLAAGNEADIHAHISKADAAVLHLPVYEIQSWSEKLIQIKPLPLLWWCSADAASASITSCEVEAPIDGILTPAMKEHELDWTLHFSEKRFFERQEWASERKQLLARIEDRKWIDMAKGILSDINRISESEAYDLLRKKAMNERKRIVDVAVSIVKAHQMLKA
ncbi:ANTAR domain-containing protein [Paenibacillus urinalis]|uniref:ANTAR domain-containing protein n=1 Tax=Paenibacillus urinalis TaxID=521520 RepID=A0AAX3MWX6_9BACL|nr:MULTISPECIES: ANTAR domain-containing protein [Paenibacillus]WDH80864.1 ANTAR domain-containing protein [Paenibacillus urinalis]WDH96919.1 ANTAR domain-containing protein [Paenibacillus urinalis]WDI00563.1 ANTAR domain-containing protein [Paenibacillus urinalis]GAK39238.1 response regulator [Paenibacillus sp. TCA20]